MNLENHNYQNFDELYMETYKEYENIVEQQQSKY